MKLNASITMAKITVQNTDISVVKYNELICLSNMENLNAVFIEQNMAQRERLVKLNQIAIHQMSILESGDNQNSKLLK